MAQLALSAIREPNIFPKIQSFLKGTGTPVSAEIVDRMLSTVGYTREIAYISATCIGNIATIITVRALFGYRIPEI